MSPFRPAPLLTGRPSVTTGLLSLAVLVTAFAGWVDAEEPPEDEQPVAEIRGEPVFLRDLDPPSGPPADDPEKRDADRRRRLQALVWSAAVEGFARENVADPTPEEIDAFVESTEREKRRWEGDWEARAAEIRKELAAPSELTADRRQELEDQLETLESLQRQAEEDRERLEDPEMRALSAASRRKVAESWIRGWKTHQALYKKYGGRVIFQQAGWEPIDAYRKLLDEAAAKGVFVLHEPSLREAVYSYFELDHTYMDKAKAEFYFEKPYWLRTPEELQAAGLSE